MILEPVFPLSARHRSRTPGATAFVLTGGGSDGAAQVGMLRELARAGIVPDLVVGASVGALNGAFFARRPALEGALELERLWRRLHRRDIFPFSIGTALRALRGGESLLEQKAVRGLLERCLGQGGIEDAAIPLRVVATAVDDGTPVCLGRGALIEALLASIAIPAILPPVTIGGRPMFDGGVASNTPIRVAIECGATRIFILPAVARAAARPRTAIEMGLHALRLMLTRQLEEHLGHIPGTVEILRVPTPDARQSSPFDFSRSADIIEAAAARTREWLARRAAEAVEGDRDARLAA